MNCLLCHHIERGVGRESNPPPPHTNASIQDLALDWQKPKIAARFTPQCSVNRPEFLSEAQAVRVLGKVGGQEGGKHLGGLPQGASPSNRL